MIVNFYSIQLKSGAEIQSFFFEKNNTLKAYLKVLFYKKLTVFMTLDLSIIQKILIYIIKLKIH